MRTNALTKQLFQTTLNCIPESINYHVTNQCNYRCKFCFANHKQNMTDLSLEQSKKLLSLLRAHNCTKINFAGGEPTLKRELPVLINYAKQLGFFVSLISNGTGLSELFLEKCGKSIDLIGLSIDSQYDKIEYLLGRTLKYSKTEKEYSHVDLIHSKVQLIKAYQIPIKINTTITGLNWNENMHQLIKEINPLRWKVFQVHAVTGINDKFFHNQNAISDNQFLSFIARHQDLNPIYELSDIMADSYCMITPDGRFYYNSPKGYEYSKPIINHKIENVIKKVNFSQEHFNLRNGDFFKQQPDLMEV